MNLSLPLSPSPGCVYIVGAGPGDPGLLTLKGAQLLSGADVVLYDDLVDRRILDLAPPECELLDVGHRGGSGVGRSQETLNEQLIRCAREGKRVVRRKGGAQIRLTDSDHEVDVLESVAAACRSINAIAAIGI